MVRLGIMLDMILVSAVIEPRWLMLVNSALLPQSNGKLLVDKVL